MEELFVIKKCACCGAENKIFSQSVSEKETCGVFSSSNCIQLSKFHYIVVEKCQKCGYCSNDIQKEVDISADKALNDILEAEKNAVDKVEEVVEKPKKSWFGWFKRDKKREISGSVNSVELNEEQDYLDDTSAELEEFLDEIPSVDPVEELKFVEQVKQEVVEEQKQVKEEVIQQPKKLAKKLTKKVEKVKPEIAEVKSDVVEVKPEIAEVKQEVAEAKQEIVEVKQEVVEVKQEVVEEVKEEVTQVEDVLSDSEIPLIRTTKAEIEEQIPEVDLFVKVEDNDKIVSMVADLYNVKYKFKTNDNKTKNEIKEIFNRKLLNIIIALENKELILKNS